MVAHKERLLLPRDKRRFREMWSKGRTDAIVEKAIRILRAQTELGEGPYRDAAEARIKELVADLRSSEKTASRFINEFERFVMSELKEEE